jgi:hypothetical protein
MTMWMGRTRRARAAMAILLLPIALALGAGSAAAAPPVAFTVLPSSLSFGDVNVNDSATLTVTVETGRKAVVLDTDTSNGTFTDALTGTCYLDWGYQVPANTSCTVDVTFAPLVGQPFSADLTVSSCMKWHADVNNTTLATCDRVRDSVTVSLDGTGVNLP